MAANREPTHQLPLAIGGDSTPTLIRTTRKANRSRVRLPVIQPALPIADDTFAGKAEAGVPAHRSQCPVERPCPRVRCEWHLFRVDAENRAGRPGLASVPRGERGWTEAVDGDMGDERPGTTLRPAWLSVRRLEVEREVKVYVSKVDGEYAIDEIRPGTLDYWLAHLRVGEPVLVFDDHTHEVVAKAKLRADGALAFDRELLDSVLCSSSAIVLTRVRGVPSCGLDLIESEGFDPVTGRGKRLTNQEIGDAIGRHRTLVAREVKAALRKLIAAGVTAEQVRELMGG